MKLTPSQRAKLQAAQAVIQELLDQDDQGHAPEALERGPDGRHLSAKGQAQLYSAFDAGLTAYQAHKKYNIAYRAARLRYDVWRAIRNKQARERSQ